MMCDLIDGTCYRSDSFIDSFGAKLCICQRGRTAFLYPAPDGDYCCRLLCRSVEADLRAEIFGHPRCFILPDHGLVRPADKKDKHPSLPLRNENYAQNEENRQIEQLP